VAEEAEFEYEVYFTRTVHTYVRVLAGSEVEASKLALEGIEVAEVGAMCLQCTAHDIQHIQIEEDENSEEKVTEITDPEDYVLLEYDPALVQPEDDGEEEEEGEEED
jgi:D-hexose-6-phosphate mutarotase